MKKLLAVLSIFALFSCAKEKGPGGDFSLSALMPGATSRTVLGAKSDGKYPVLWSSGDCIRVNGVDSKALSALSAGGSEAVFSFSEGLQAPYNALYGAAGGDDIFEIPSVQEFSDGNIRKGCAPMYSTGSLTSLRMHHLSCIISLPLSGSATVTGLSLSSLDGLPLCGRFRMKKDGNVFSGEADAVFSPACIEMTVPDGGVDISGGRTFCFAIRPQALTKGLNIDVYCSDGRRMNLVAFAGETLNEGLVYEFPRTSFTPSTEPVTLISSYASLKEFAALVASGEKYLHARLAADIEAAADWVPLEGFTGDFDGGGYCISGLKTAFANELRGCVRNLVLDSSISISSKDDITGSESVYWAGILANRIYTGGLVSGCKVRGSISYSQWGTNLAVGAIAGYAPRGTLENCEISASVHVTGNGGGAIYAGGVVGYIYSSADPVNIRGCLCTGNMVLDGTFKSVSAGGIAGNVNSPHLAVISRNSFSGTVTLAPTAVLKGDVNIGGIVGSSLYDIADCTFDGEISLLAASTAAHNIGGIAGNVKVSSVSGCLNGGRIRGESESAGVVRCGGIAGYVQPDGAAVTATDFSGCVFSGEIGLSFLSHSTVYAKAIAGLCTAEYSETDCVDKGIISVI
ncbi:MAG: hypothetical protein IJS62_01785 [Bacteroidales bacterium]|nr:hypothetical protein [Bacteroidales bacterium]